MLIIMIQLVKYCHMRGGHHNVQRFGTVYASMVCPWQIVALRFGKRREIVGHRFATITIHQDLPAKNLQAMDEAVKDAGLEVS